VGDDAATVNAYTTRDERHQFSGRRAGAPLYDPKMDDAPNYGNTGATMHELTHGFTTRAQFDAKGTSRIGGPSRMRPFVARAACVSTQYSQYTAIDDIKINGKLTLGEDVADLAARCCYMAWKDATKDQKLEPSMIHSRPALLHRMAQWACGESPASKRLHALTIRIRRGIPHNGVVSNMPSSPSFRLQIRPAMVRANACRVW